jgi:hypothetical protein
MSNEGYDDGEHNHPRSRWRAGTDLRSGGYLDGISVMSSELQRLQFAPCAVVGWRTASGGSCHPFLCLRLLPKRFTPSAHGVEGATGRGKSVWRGPASLLLLPKQIEVVNERRS